MARLVLLLALLAAVAAPARAQDTVAALDRAALRVVQAALARAGTYDGLIDGAWGRRSAQALSRAAAAEGIADTGEEAAVARVLHRYRAAWEGEGWARVPVPGLRLQFVAPFGRMAPLPATTADHAWGAPDGSAGVTVHRESPAAMRARHAALEAAARRGSDVYRVRRDAVWITGAELEGGVRQYLRSERTGGSYESVAVRVRGPDFGPLMLVTGSMVAGPLPDLAPPDPDGVGGGLLAAAMRRHPAPAGLLPAGPGRTRQGTGLALAMDAVLVPAGFVKGCRSVAAPGDRALAEVWRDGDAGLAVLRGDAGPGGVAVLAAPGAVALGLPARLEGRSPQGTPLDLPVRVAAARAGVFLAGDAGGIAPGLVTAGRFVLAGGPAFGAEGWAVLGAGGAVIGMVPGRPPGLSARPVLAAGVEEIARAAGAAGVRALRADGGAPPGPGPVTRRVLCRE